MKKVLYFLMLLFAGAPPVSAQFADPYISISMRPPQIPLGATTTLEILEGNFGSTPVCADAMIITVSMGPNAEITGIAAGSDARWTASSLTSGPGNTIQMVNTAGGFGTFDLAYVYLTVKAVAYGGPNNCAANITYVIANNSCAGGAPNAVHGNLEITNDNSVSSLTVPVLNTLPVLFSSFTTDESGCGGYIRWTTEEEDIISKYEIQQSTDGVRFNTIQQIPSKGNGENSYEVKIHQGLQEMYYRVVATDIDNKTFYTRVSSMHLKACHMANTVSMFPVPAIRGDQVTVQTERDDPVTYKISDMTGRVIKSGSFTKRLVFAQAVSGVFFLEITAEGFREIRKIIIQ